MNAIVFALFVVGLVAAAPTCGSTLINEEFPYGAPNPYPIVAGDVGGNITKFVAAVEYGSLYTVVVPNGPEGNATSAEFNLLHLYGTPYQMGYAQGSLLGPQVKEIFTQEWAEVEAQIEEVLTMLPAWLAELVTNDALDVALDITYEITKDWTNPSYYEELQGIADASGCDYMLMMRVHQLAGLTQGACSMSGIWGSALADSDGLFQLRALDWDMSSPVRNASAIIVRHPNVMAGSSTSNPNPYGHAWASVGFIGWVGALTGVSEKLLGISEIGVSYPTSMFGAESRIGEPFVFVLRDILEQDNSIEAATARLATTKRTCDLILGVGSGSEKSFLSYAYSFSQMYPMSDKNMKPYNETWHPRITGAVYHGMDWDCPSYNSALGTEIKKYYGKIDINAMIQISAGEMSGFNHIAIYDLVQGTLYVSFASPLNQDPLAENAYQRQYVSFDLDSLWAEPAPVGYTTPSQ